MSTPLETVVSSIDPTPQDLAPATGASGSVASTAVASTAVAGPVSDVASGRERLDAIDAAIRTLIDERIAVSHGVQALRRAEGRPGVQHARENEIITSYVNALGDEGADIALAILTLCRGRIG